MKNKTFISRRKFILITTTSIGFIALYNRNKIDKKVINYELTKIKKYNQKRKELLINNFKETYISDLRNSRTIWVNKSLMTYADLWKYRI